MKFYVMMAAQSNAIVHFKRVLREQRNRQNMVRVQSDYATTASAYFVTRKYVLGPFLAFGRLSNRLFCAAVHIVRIVCALIAQGDNAPLRAFALTRF